MATSVLCGHKVDSLWAPVNCMTKSTRQTCYVCKFVFVQFVRLCFFPQFKKELGAILFVIFTYRKQAIYLGAMHGAYQGNELKNDFVKKRLRFYLLFRLTPT